MVLSMGNTGIEFIIVKVKFLLNTGYANCQPHYHNFSIYFSKHQRPLLKKLTIQQFSDHHHFFLRTNKKFIFSSSALINNSSPFPLHYYKFEPSPLIKCSFLTNTNINLGIISRNWKFYISKLYSPHEDDWKESQFLKSFFTLGTNARSNVRGNVRVWTK